MDTPSLDSHQDYIQFYICKDFPFSGLAHPCLIAYHFYWKGSPFSGEEMDFPEYGRENPRVAWTLWIDLKTATESFESWGTLTGT